MTDTTDHKVKPYSPSAEYRYFLYDPNDSYTFYSTPEERDIAAKNLIEDYLVDGEWSEQVVDIYAGKATHLVSEVERIDRVGKVDEDGYDENGEYWADDDVDYKCNYGLRPLVPTPPAERGERRRPCEICGGLGTIDETLGGYAFSNQAAECPGCGGSGCVSIDATPPAEGEAELLAEWMYRLADERSRNRRRGIRPHPSALTRTGAVIQRQAAVIQQQAAELMALRRILVPSPPAEGEVGELVAWLQRTADVLTDGNTQTPRLTRAAALLQEQEAELAQCREALRRVRLQQRIPGGGW